MLLDEIIDIAVDDKQPLPVLLRKCLVLAQKLRNDRLKAWANQELNGYGSTKNLPEYRIFNAYALGDFSGAFGSSAKNMPIPPSLLREEHRDWATTVYLTQAVGTLQDIASNTDDRAVRFGWPADLVALYQDTIQTENGMVLVAAKQVLSTSTIAGLLDNVRNITLNMALEIQSEVGNTQDLTKITPDEAAKVEKTITNNIYGGTTIIAGGQSRVNANISQTTISIGHRDQLDEALKKAGLSDGDLTELTEAEKADGGKKLGPRVMDWVKKNASKAVIGGVKLGAEVTKEVLVAYLKQYSGVN
jgi:AbiTii-like protein